MLCIMDDTDIRELFTQIGCLMEDASVVAILWAGETDLNQKARLTLLREANDAVKNLIEKIEASVL